MYLALALCLALAIPFSVAGCKKGDGKVVRINEVTHSVFYAPLYLSDALGYFKDEGFDIELTNGGGADKTMAAVLAGGADIGFCGPEAVVYTYLGGSDDCPKVFGPRRARKGRQLRLELARGQKSACRQTGRRAVYDFQLRLQGY